MKRNNNSLKAASSRVRMAIYLSVVGVVLAASGQASATPFTFGSLSVGSSLSSISTTAFSTTENGWVPNIQLNASYEALGDIGRAHADVYTKEKNVVVSQATTTQSSTRPDAVPTEQFASTSPAGGVRSAARSHPLSTPEQGEQNVIVSSFKLDMLMNSRPWFNGVYLPKTVGDDLPGQYVGGLEY